MPREAVRSMESARESGRVSVLIPVYNAEKYLGRCLDSVLGQSYENVEIVAVNDGSSDGSPTILDEYAARYPGRLVVEHRPNGGVASARNRAIELARGEYLMFVDNDDYLDEGCVETFVAAISRERAQVVCGGYRRPDESGRVVVEVTPEPGTEWAPFLVSAAWAKIYRTDFVRENNLRFLDSNIAEDLYFTLPAVLYAERVTVIRYCGYNWFYNVESVSSTKHKSSSGLQFEFSLDALMALARNRDVEVNDLLRHYFVKYVAWFLTYTYRGDSRQERADNYRRYVAWLDRNLPDWRDEALARPGRPTGDAALSRAAVWLFARHPTLFRAALGLYGKLRKHS